MLGVMMLPGLAIIAPNSAQARDRFDDDDYESVERYCRRQARRQARREDNVVGGAIEGAIGGAIISVILGGDADDGARAGAAIGGVGTAIEQSQTYDDLYRRCLRRNR